MNEYTKYIPVKSAIESLFGSEAWYALKESNSISDWKKYTEKTLKALGLSIHESVKYFDKEWRYEVDQEISRGIKSIKCCKSIDEIIASLAGSLIKISFLQVGFMPNRKGSDRKFSLKKENWDLSLYRSVVYLQSQDQKESLFWSVQQKRIGSQAQIIIHDEYRASKSKLSYSEWCTNNGKA